MMNILELVEAIERSPGVSEVLCGFNKNNAHITFTTHQGTYEAGVGFIDEYHRIDELHVSRIMNHVRAHS
jgi:hypothetical protein